MFHSVSNRQILLLGSILLGASCLPLAAYAAAPAGHHQTPRPKAPQHPTEISGGSEAVIVTGTREFGKKARDSISPIDVVSSRQITATGQPTLRDSLSLLLPSLTVPTAGFDAGALTDSIALRGLNPNETLVLVDGKRRHTTANIYADPGPAQGSTPVDIDMIPMSMIDHVEVLKDGASAQYGSDAVAGVVNIILKKQVRGLNMRSNSGITSDGDGFQQGLYLDSGFNLNNRGFVHIGGDFVHQDHALRSAPDSRTGTLDNKILSQPEQTRESIAVNAGYDLTDSIQAYGSATYAHRHAESFQNYRTPSSLQAYPGYAALYPNGYSPVMAIEENDFEVTTGIKGTLAGWHWDLSTVYGRDFDRFDALNSLSKSVYTATGRTPTTFQNAQGYNNSQWTSALDLTRKINLSFWPHSINIAGGAAYRYESYSMGTGTPDSIYGTGSDAIPGTTAFNAGNWNRDIASGYIDISTHLTKHWQVDLAGRIEHYTDVGNAKTGKIATRYDFSPRFAVRGTFSNSFHAPTLPQQHYSALAVSPASPQSKGAARGLIAANSPGALTNGATALKPEMSTNADIGIVMEPIRKLHVTVDAYQINLRNRIAPGGNIFGGQAYNALVANNIPIDPEARTWPDSYLSTNWFANVASTRTQGLDITATYPTDLKKYGHIDWDTAINLNRTRMHHLGTTASGNPLLNAQYISYLTTAFPRSKIIFGGRWHSVNNTWSVAVHEIRYGQTTSQLSYYSGPLSGIPNTFSPFQNAPKWTTNASVTYNINPHWSATLGGNNIFAAYPSVVPANHRFLGAPKYYMSTNQLGILGGYYYLDISARF